MSRDYDDWVWCTDGNVTLGVGVYLTNTWRSGDQWYRKYSDGFVEQGGYQYLNYGNTTVTFNTAFATTNYTVSAINVGHTESVPFVVSRSTASMVFSRLWTGDKAGAQNALWYACGY